MSDAPLRTPRDGTINLTGGFGAGPAPAPAPANDAHMTTISIDDDGGVTISSPTPRKPRDAAKNFGENLALNDEIDLHGIAYEVLEGIENDISSRKQFMADYVEGIGLLGLSMMEQGADSGKVSKVGHPLLLEAVIKAQSAAGAELMPAGGPCKVEEMGGSDAVLDATASAFEADMNAYLTRGAPEYYPDMDRGLFGYYFSGNMFKKVYEHPLRHRPVSETVAMEDLIVAEGATDLETAIRITHSAEMSRNQIRRMQRFADWRDVELMQPSISNDPAKRAQDHVMGLSAQGARPSDIPHTIYETTVDLDLHDYGFDDPGAPDMPITYVVTIDKDSKQVLAIRRGWKQGDKEFTRRQRFVHYGMVPAFGFLCLGFVHLLGNQTKALRAIWRILVTAGMYSNAPAGMKVKGVRSGTSEINPGPGEWTDVDIGSMTDIRQAIMAMPYKDVSPEFMALAESIGQDAMRMSGAVEMEVGEGRTNVPVGTMMSMLEVATQVMSAVHKRAHRSQRRELELIKECFAENPEALTKFNPDPARQWQSAQDFADLRLMPASDPNIPSQIHRIQLATALVQVAGSNPDLYDRTAVHKRAWRIMGVNDVDSIVLPQPAPPPPGGPGAAPPDPLIGQAKMAEVQLKAQQLQMDQQDTQRKAATEQIEAAHQQQQLQIEAQSKAAQLAAQERIEAMRNQTEMERLRVEQVRAAAEMHQEHTLQTQQHEHEQGMAKQQADTTVKVAKMRPKPAAKPAGGKK